MCSVSVNPINGCSDINDPEFYRHSEINKHINNDIEDIYKRYKDPVQNEIEFVKFVLDKFSNSGLEVNTKNLDKYLIEGRRKFKKMYSKVVLLNALLAFDNNDPYHDLIKKIKPLLIKKEQKSTSGILSVTLFTGPDFKNENGTTEKFSCKYDCYFCPSEPGQPKSYLQSEPGVLRANQNNFDCFLQFNDRVSTLQMMGHEPDKLEVLVLGGTFHSYPKFYREQFIRDIFYSANTFGLKKSSELRPRLSLSEEKLINETANCKIIGLTLETRPDEINKESIIELRYLGCTRVQLGLQHTNNVILKKINRAHSVECAIRAIKLLKDSGYKIDLHLMQNLPGSTKELDIEMSTRILEDHELQVDQLKLYPCSIVPWTKIKEWYTNGSYIPYRNKDLLEVLIDFKSRVHPWIRLNRIIRDIPSQYITDNTSNPDMRNDIHEEMSLRNLKCQCIRCREITNKNIKDFKLLTREYVGSGSREIFISYETSSNEIIGFCRLRLPEILSDLDIKNPKKCVFPELNGFALVRELHVYGQLKPTIKNTNSNCESKTQHFGFGTRLMNEAERISKENGYDNIAVISGVGVRNYYRKLGYTLNNGPSEMMVKSLQTSLQTSIISDDLKNIFIYYIFYILLFVFVFTNLEYVKNFVLFLTSVMVICAIVVNFIHVIAVLSM